MQRIYLLQHMHYKTNWPLLYANSFDKGVSLLPIPQYVTVKGGPHVHVHTHGPKCESLSLLGNCG